MKEIKQSAADALNQVRQAAKKLKSLSVHFLLWLTTLRSPDVLAPATMERSALNGGDVPCWMPDTK